MAISHSHVSNESDLVLRQHSEFGFEPRFVSDNGPANRPGNTELKGLTGH